MEWIKKKTTEAKALWFLLFCFTAITKTLLRLVSMCGLPLVSMQVSATTMGCHKVENFSGFPDVLRIEKGGNEVTTGMIFFRPACLLYKGTHTHTKKKIEKTPRQIKKTHPPALTCNLKQNKYS